VAGIAFITRKALLTQNNVTVNSGSDFGSALTTPFTRLTGLASVTGSLSIRLRGSIDPTGAALVSSVWVANSGVNFLDVPNRASYIAFDITACATPGQTATILITGEPLR
jgi:hypothetical protein